MQRRNWIEMPYNMLWMTCGPCHPSLTAYTACVWYIRVWKAGGDSTTCMQRQAALQRLPVILCVCVSEMTEQLPTCSRLTGVKLHAHRHTLGTHPIMPTYMHARWVGIGNWRCVGFKTIIFMILFACMCTIVKMCMFGKKAKPLQVSFDPRQVNFLIYF